ncbi:hypothetical protein AGMMS50212_07880 [Spirochaetia bacterium]|nr:hypothetical protein AGMMS50212_07850 [Spirochaetia bacterium]GHV83448.1 hypothetical protein AGMMS50212_07880 [Spirochaetia bacterium]
MLGQIKFPIGLKLVLIISGLLLTGMSAVIAMVWLLVSNDVEKTAIFNNDSTNAMSAGDAKTVFASEISKTKAFLHIIANNASAEAVDSQTEYFFTQNNEIAAIISDENLINEQFFIDNEIDLSLVSTFVRQKAAADRTEKPAAEAVYVINAAPVFNIPVLVLYFQAEGKETAVIFSAQVLSESFGNGAYLSFMTDEKLNLLIHSNFELIRDSKTIAGDSFAESFVKSGAGSGKQRYFDTENREYFASARHIDDFNIMVWTRVPADVVFEGINTTTRRNMYLAAAVWFIAVMFIYLFAKTISRPLKDLRAAAESIEDGHYKLDLKVYSQDETGILTAAVLSMSHVLENFERFTNKELARLARKGTLETGGADKDACNHSVHVVIQKFHNFRRRHLFRY